MPKKKERPRSREEQERIFKQAAREHGADESGKLFERALGKIIKNPKKSKGK